MSKTAWVLGLCFALTFPLASIGSDDREENSSWMESMKRFSESLSELMPLLVTSDLKEEKKNRKKVLDLSKKILDSTHSVDKNPNAPSSNPALRFLTRDFRKDMTSAIALMEQGNWERGQEQLNYVTRYCISCHTLQGGQSGALHLDLSPNVDLLSNLEKGNFFASIRDFEQAIIHYEYALTDEKWAKSNPEGWSEAFTKLMAITIRVHNNPSLTLELISRFFDAGSYPEDLKDVALIWRGHAKEWRQEGDRKSGTLKKAQQLLKKAKDLESEGRESFGLIYFLRTSAILNHHMVSSRKSADQRVLYLAGQSAEGLKGLNFWELPEDYYRACFYTKQTSKVGQKCRDELKRLEGKDKRV